jgi:NAD(P)-dependent dehydrogenase (short-subunit alcohol dehydrogenase family)
MSTERMDLRGKVVVITGAGRGLGAGMAATCAARGARLALVDRDGDPLDAVVAQCGEGSRGWVADVTDAARLAEVASEVEQHFGRVDVLVVNAGVGAGGLFAATDAEAWDRVVEINLWGSIRTVRAFLPAVTSSSGHVLQVASIAALVPAPMMSAYCTSKSGVEAFAHCLRGELLGTGVTVGVGYLGFTDTDMVRTVDADPVLGRMRASMPWPFNVTHALPPAVVRLVAGIEQRKEHVYAQRWIRALPLVRGALPTLTARRAGPVLSTVVQK